MSPRMGALTAWLVDGTSIGGGVGHDKYQLSTDSIMEVKLQ